MQPEPQPTTNPQEITTTPTATVKLPWSKPRFWRIDDAGPDTGKPYWGVTEYLAMVGPS